MKIVKLILLAAVIGGIVFLINKFGNIVSDNDVDNDDGIKIENIEILKPFIEEYTVEWKERGKWDPVLYKSNLDKADLFRTSGDITEAEYDKLRRNISKDVLNKLVKLLETDFRASSLIDSKVDYNMQGIDAVEKNLPNDSQIKKMKDAWNLYCEAKKFVLKKYAATSFSLGMSEDCCSWISFDSHKSRILYERDGYCNAKLYKEYFIANTLLSNGFAGVESKLEQCRRGYNLRIVDAIKDYYGRIPKFDESGYSQAMNSAANETEWNQANEDFECAWNLYIDNFKLRRRKISEISTRFKKSVNDASMQKVISSLVSRYVIPEKPSKPSKPRFND